ncbi:MAG: hypothetical protein ACPGVS_08455, partial [Primorskyibacter sp.]
MPNATPPKAPHAPRPFAAFEWMIAWRYLRARRAEDEDLRELGITNEVMQLLDDLANGKGIDNSIDEVVRAAMRG